MTPILYLRYLLLLLLFSASLSSKAQLQVFHNLPSAIEAAKNSNKHLIILRTEFSTIRWSREKNRPIAAWYIDELLKSEKMQNELQEKFVLYAFDYLESSNNDQIAMNETYLYGFPPNMIILNDKLQHIGYLELTKFDLQSDLIAMIRTSIEEFKPMVDKSVVLELKFEKKKISSEELSQLIQHRANLSMSSKKYLNYLALNQMKFPGEDENLLNNILAEIFTIEDPFFNYFLSNIDIPTEHKLMFALQMKKLSVHNADVPTYHKLIPAIDSLNEKYYADEIEGTEYAAVFPKSSFVDYSGQLLESINVYAKAGASKLLSEVSESYVGQILNNYDERRNDHIALTLSMLEGMKSSIMDHHRSADTSSVFNWDKFLEEAVKEAAMNMDQDIASNFNEIAWIYYLHAEGESDLKKAVAWCQQSLDFHSTKHNNDTMAHLHYKLGNKDLAIYYQTIAVSLAVAEGLPEEYIQRYKDQLEKFKRD